MICVDLTCTEKLQLKVGFAEHCASWKTGAFTGLEHHNSMNRIKGAWSLGQHDDTKSLFISQFKTQHKPPLSLVNTGWLYSSVKERANTNLLSAWSTLADCTPVRKRELIQTSSQPRQHWLIVLQWERESFQLPQFVKRSQCTRFIGWMSTPRCIGPARQRHVVNFLHQRVISQSTYC